jgi:membrane fusion protein (multidrug efflux system)
VAGVIAKKWALPGDVIQPGQAIFTVYDKDQVWVTANFEETKLAAIHPGDPVEISIDAYDGQIFKGTVLMIGTAAAAEFSLIPPNNASGNFTKVTQRVPVKISINRPAGNTNEDPPALLPGLSVEVKVRVDSE